MATIESYFMDTGPVPHARSCPDRQAWLQDRARSRGLCASVAVSSCRACTSSRHGQLLTGPRVVDWLAGRGDLARSTQD